MLHKVFFSVWFVTLYLFIYAGLIQFDQTIGYGVIMLLFSPLLICWMVYTVLKYGKFEGPELGDEEFGYQDKSKDKLGVF